MAAAAAVSPRVIEPSITVDEEGSRKVFVYVDIPELKVKRSFPNFTKHIPVNADQITLDFQAQSLKLILHIRTKQNLTKIYQLFYERLIGEIRPRHCSIKYQRGGCWIKLVKVEPRPWMSRICDDHNPGLNLPENEDDKDSSHFEERQLRDTDMKPFFKSVPLAPPVRYQLATSNSPSS